MRIKKVLTVVAAALMLCCCGSASANASAVKRAEQESFYMGLVESDGYFSVYQDSETGVQYIVYEDYNHGGYSWFGIVPRYNADGTLCTAQGH